MGQRPLSTCLTSWCRGKGRTYWQTKQKTFAKYLISCVQPDGRESCKKNPQFHGQIFQVCYRLVMCLLLNTLVRKFYIEKCIAQVCENYITLKHLSSQGSVMYKIALHDPTKVFGSTVCGTEKGVTWGGTHMRWDLASPWSHSLIWKHYFCYGFEKIKWTFRFIYLFLEKKKEREKREDRIDFWLATRPKTYEGNSRATGQYSLSAWHLAHSEQEAGLSLPSPRRKRHSSAQPSTRGSGTILWPPDKNAHWQIPRYL